MGPRANYKYGALALIVVCRLYNMNFVDMWDLKACPGKFLRIRSTEIEFESIQFIIII